MKPYRANPVATEIPAFVEAANHRLMKRMAVISVATSTLFFFATTFTGTSDSIAKMVAGYVPAVDKLMTLSTEIGSVPGRFFSLAILVSPIYLIWLLWGEDPLLRIQYSAAKRGGGSVGAIIFAYAILLPFFILILTICLVAPFDVSDAPNLWGQHVFYWMLNSYIGLLCIGTLLFLGLLIFAFMVALLVWLPFMKLYRLAKGSR